MKAAAYGEHCVGGFVGGGGGRGFSTLKGSRAASKVAAGEGEDVQSARGEGGRETSIGQSTPSIMRILGYDWRFTTLLRRLVTYRIAQT